MSAQTPSRAGISQQSIVYRDPNPTGSSTPLTTSTAPRDKAEGVRSSSKHEKPFQCPCGKRFLSSAGLRSHQNDTRRARPEKCRPADETAEALGTAKKKSVLKAESKMEDVTCGCGRKFPTIGALRHHQADKTNLGKCRSLDVTVPEQAVKPGAFSQDVSINIKCGCGRRFSTVDSIQQHQQNNQMSWTCHTWTTIGPVQAAQSDKSVRTDGLGRLYKPFQCACGQRFAAPLEIQCHHSQWSSFHSMKCREGISTFMGRPFDPSKGATDPAVAKLDTIKQSDVPPGQSQVHWTRQSTGQHLDTILASSVVPAATPVSSRDGYVVLGSYNWTSGGRGQNIYFIPGAAPVWQELSVPMQLRPLADLDPVDSEAAQDLPDYPYQASLKAIKVMNPDCSFDYVDVLTDWKVLRALLALTAGKPGEAFRMKLYLVKKTLVIEMRSERAETWCKEKVDPVRQTRAQRRYGRSLEPTFTKWNAGLEQSEAHVRVIQYNLGSLSCAVRFQGNNCYSDPEEAESTGTGPAGGSADTTGLRLNTVKGVVSTAEQAAVKKQTEDTINASEKTTRPAISARHITDKGSTLDRTIPTKTSLATIGPEIIIRGSGTPQEHMAEIKMKTHNKIATAATVKPGWMTQLWFTRIANLIVGKHHDGLVQHIQHHRLSAGGAWEQWEEQENNQLALRKLVSLLSELKALVAEHAAAIGGHGAVFAVYDREAGGPGLRMYESNEDRESPLPEDLIKSLWSVDKWGA